MLYASQLLPRRNQFNTLLRGKRLFQQYFEDQYHKLDFERVEYLRRNQSALCASDCTSACEQLGDSQSTENKLSAALTVCIFTISAKHVHGDLYSSEESERSRLPAVLLHVSGATFFKDLQTVEGNTLSAYRETCL